MKQKIITSQILEQSKPHKIIKYCFGCGDLFRPIYDQFSNVCPKCSNMHRGFKLDLNPTFKHTKMLIGGGYTSRITTLRDHPKIHPSISQVDHIQRDRVLRYIRDQIIKEWHDSGLLTYEELEIFFGIKTRELHDRTKAIKDQPDLLTKNCLICRDVREFGNNFYLWKQWKYCKKCRKIYRRKEFNYIREKEDVEKKKKEFLKKLNGVDG